MQANEMIPQESNGQVFDVVLSGYAGMLSVQATDKEAVLAALEPVADKISVVTDTPFAFDRKSAELAGCYVLGSKDNRSSLADVVVKLSNKRKLWWIADSQSEAQAWAEDIREKGGTVEKLEPVDGSGLVDVVFSIRPKDAERFLGPEPDVSSYLDENLALL